MGICNKVAGILASLIFGYIALNNTDALEASLQTMDAITKEETLNNLATRVVVPYIILAIALSALAIAVLFSSLPDINDAESEEESRKDVHVTKTSIFQFPYLLLGVLAIFLYVGAEVIAGDTIISYGKSLKIDMSYARYFTIGTLACMLIGYVIGIFAIPKYFSQEFALKACAILGIIFASLAIVTPGITSVVFIALLGLANSLMWPAIWPLAIGGLGKFTKTGSALLVMAIAGGAILPLVYGKISLSLGNQQGYLILIPCYLYILYFSIKGHKLGKG